MADRILITGSRDWTSRPVIFQALLDNCFSVINHDNVLVHGGATGADRIAAHYATMFGWKIEEHLPDWDSCGINCIPEHKRQRQDGTWYCPRSGFIRNDKMVKLGADVCLAFIKNESRGATMAANLAEKAGIRVVRYVA